MSKSLVTFPKEKEFVVKRKMVTDSGLTDFVENQGDEYYQAAGATPITTTTTCLPDGTGCTTGTGSSGSSSGTGTGSGTTGTGSSGSGTTGTINLCDSIIEQLNVSVSGNQATVNAIVKQGTIRYSSPITGQISYSLDGAAPVLANSTFQLNNLSVGSHTITAAAVCSDGVSLLTQTKTFTVAPAPVTPPATPPICDVEITNVKIEVNSVATGNDIYFQVSFGGTTNAKPIGVAYSNAYVNRGEIQYVNKDNFTLRNLPAGENKIVLYPICEGNILGSKSLTKVFTIAPYPPNINQTFSGVPYGANMSPATSESNIVVIKEEKTFLQKNWLWLLIAAGVIYVTTNKKNG
jgi:hypothetical protein